LFLWCDKVLPQQPAAYSLLNFDFTKDFAHFEVLNISCVCCFRHLWAGNGIEEAMNCGNCNTRIDYNYVTECPQCGCAMEASNLPKLDPSTSSGKESRWPYYVGNVLYVLVTSAVGMIAGAVVFYFTAAVLYLALSSPETIPGEHCGRGMAIGMLSILTGGFMGTVGGAVFAVKHPARSN
jgi:hypothetical protein